MPCSSAQPSTGNQKGRLSTHSICMGISGHNHCLDTSYMISGHSLVSTRAPIASLCLITIATLPNNISPGTAGFVIRLCRVCRSWDSQRCLALWDVTIAMPKSTEEHSWPLTHSCGFGRPQGGNCLLYIRGSSSVQAVLWPTYTLPSQITIIIFIIIIREQGHWAKCLRLCGH